MTFRDIRTDGHTCTVPHPITPFNSVRTVQKKAYVFEFQLKSYVTLILSFKVKHLEQFLVIKNEMGESVTFGIHILVNGCSIEFHRNVCDLSYTFIVQLLEFYCFCHNNKMA